MDRQRLDADWAQKNHFDSSSNLPKNEKLYHDYELKENKLQCVRDKEETEMKKMQSNKHTNKRSAYICKYYVPIHKRVDTEIEKRKAKLK